MPATLPDRTLRAGAVVLEPIVPKHAARLFTLLQAPALYTYIPHDAPRSVQELATLYTRWAARGSDDRTETWLNYAIFDRKLNEYAGTVQATVQRSGEAHIAYEVFPHLWRRRYATMACIALAGYVFSQFRHVEAVSALLDTRNTASWRLLESLGFRRTGLIEEADVFKGHRSDEYIYAITRAEFFRNGQALRRPMHFSRFRWRKSALTAPAP